MLGAGDNTWKEQNLARPQHWATLIVVKVVSGGTPLPKGMVPGGRGGLTSLLCSKVSWRYLPLGLCAL